MKLVIISSKRCWHDNHISPGYVTTGGFPIQVREISHLFDETTLVMGLSPLTMPTGTILIDGHNLNVCPLLEPPGIGLHRKLALLTWIPRNLPKLWRAVKDADAIHTPVPGDLGFIGLVIGLVQKKPIFVRHCGTWGSFTTWADRLLIWLLERTAGGRNVVMATGGGNHPPSTKNLSIEWIHATTLDEHALAAIPSRQFWRRGDPLRLVFVGRLDRGKNVQAIIKALPLIQEIYPQTQLDIVGGGPCLKELQQLVIDMGIEVQPTFYGNVPHSQVMQILTRNDLFLFPTQVKEGFPKAVLEALAHGLPVIATSVSVLPYLIGDRLGKILSNPKPETLAEAVLETISDEYAMAEMSHQAQLVSHQFTLEIWRTKIGERLAQAWGPLTAV